jgi:hypothetical protein
MPCVPPPVPPPLGWPVFSPYALAWAGVWQAWFTALQPRSLEDIISPTRNAAYWRRVVAQHPHEPRYAAELAAAEAAETATT